MLNLAQFREHVVQPVLRYLDPDIPWSVGAENLLVGTALQESGLTYLDQLAPGPGPAYGVFQMEARTFSGHLAWLDRQPYGLQTKVRTLQASWPDGVEQLRTNLAFAAAMCRVHYRRAPEAIPAGDDLVGLGRLWKLRYNTPLGAGTVEQFVTGYRRAHGSPR